MTKRLSSFLAAALLSFISIASADVKEEEIQAYIARQTGIMFNDYIRSRGVVSSPEWEAVVLAVFTRLTENSGESAFTLTVKIVKDPSFNAMCFGGGQFVVNSGTLEFFDAVINGRSGRSSVPMNAGGDMACFMERNVGAPRRGRDNARWDTCCE